MKKYSIIKRLTLVFTISSFSLLLIASCTLYWLVAHQLSTEDIQILKNQTDTIAALVGDRWSESRADTFSKEIETYSKGITQTQFRVISEQGVIYFQTPSFPELVNQSEINNTGMRKTEWLEFTSLSGRKIELSRRRIAHSESKTDSGLFIEIAMDRTDEEALLSFYRLWVFIILGAGLFLSSFIGYRLARKAIRPLRDIGHEIDQIEVSRLSSRLKIEHVPIELEPLANNFNLMLGRLEEAFDKINRFSGNLAHELRTPLQNLQGALEVSLSKTRTVEEYKLVQVSNLEEVGRLGAIIQSLELLSKAESPDSLNRIWINPVEEIRSLLEFFEIPAQEKNIKIELFDLGENLKLNVDRELFQRAIGNVLSNSIDHSGRAGVTRIEFEKAPNRIRITISDTGVGISNEHLDRLTERFYRVDPSRSNTTGGHLGLGLSIVKSVVESHGGEIVVSSEPGKGTRVSTSFPI